MKKQTRVQAFGMILAAVVVMLVIFAVLFSQQTLGLLTTLATVSWNGTVIH
jgi:hypothetical protein